VVGSSYVGVTLSLCCQGTMQIRILAARRETMFIVYCSLQRAMSRFIQIIERHTDFQFV
jgi:hypothetical protein